MCAKKLQILIVLLLIKTLSFSQSWHKLSNLSYNVTIKQIETSNDGKIYVLTNENYPFYSTDGGAHWQTFAPPPFSIFLLNARKMHVNKSTNRVFFGTSFHGISYTSNLGSSWGQEFFSTDLTSGLHEGIHQIASSNDTIVVSGDYSLLGSIQRYFYSTNNGNTWSTVEQGYGICEDLILENSKWIVATGLGIQESADMGNTWNVLAFNNANLYSCRSIIKANANNYYCVLLNIPLNQFQIYQSNNLTSWNLLNSFTSSFYYDANYAPQSNSLLLATKEGLMQFDLGTNTASTISTEPTEEAEEGITSNAIYYGTDINVGVRTATAPSFSWTSLTNGLQSTNGGAYILQNNKLFSASGSRLVSIKPSLSLSAWNYSLPNDSNNTNIPVYSYLKKNSAGIYIGGNNNIFKTTDDGASWTSITAPSVMPYNTLGYHNFNSFNATKNNQLYISMLNDNGILRRSTNNGVSWDSVFSSFSVLQYSSIVSDANNLIYASYSTIGLQNKLIKSTDGGNTWTDISHPFLNTIPSTINLVMDNASNLYIASSAKIYQMPSQGVFNPVDVPWDTSSADIYRLNIAFDLNNKMVVNASGNEFCSECGVYRYDYTNWETLSTPNIITPYTPTFGLELLYDSLPLVRTNYSYTAGAFNDMGYYYYGASIYDYLNKNIDESPNVYPNPTTGIINLSYFNSLSNYEILNAQGQLVKKGKLSGMQEKYINIESLEKGFYLLKLNTKNNTYEKKILKL